MVTFRTLTVERRFSEAPPGALLGHLSHLREFRDDAFLHAGNLVVRLRNHVRRIRVERAIEDVCTEYGSVHRAMLNRVNDTSDTSEARLYWYRGGELQLEEAVETGQWRDSPLAWMSADLEQFAGEPAHSGGLSDSPFGYQTEPMVYLALEHGFYGLPCYDVVFPDDHLERATDSTGDEGPVQDITLHVRWPTAAHEGVRRFGATVRPRLKQVANQADPGRGLRLRRTAVSDGVVHLVVDGVATLSPRQTVTELRAAVSERYRDQFGTRLEWPHGHVVTTGEPSVDVGHADHDVQYHLAWGFRGSPDAVHEQLRDALAAAADDHGFDVEAVDVRAGTVTATVACDTTHSPWLVGHWLRQRWVTDAECPAMLEWTAGICTATRPFTAAELEEYRDRVG